LEADVKNFRNSAAQPSALPKQQGFTLVEVMISMVVLTIGLVALLGVLGYAMSATQNSQDLAVSKQLANEAIEGILTARETSNIPWSSIQNTGAGGIFLPGLQPVYNAGADGIIGTADDAASGEQTLQLPGPDGIFGTADDIFLPLTNYQRQIDIEPVVVNGTQLGNLRSVTITIQYQAPKLKVPKNYILTTFISQYQ
jgi:prepilin-type N-terminal cleavage/methylation domain-containing protein